jgi:hypothetical protein
MMRIKVDVAIKINKVNVAAAGDHGPVLLGHGGLSVLVVAYVDVAVVISGCAEPWLVLA